jgi:hypothetical protein
MTKPFEKWTVLPHGKLTEVDEGLLTVVGDFHMPLGDFPRRMTVARVDDGRLVIYSAIALHEDEMRQLERYGTPAVLVVPGVMHRMDAKPWRERYPAMIVVAPPGARARVEGAVHVDSTALELDDPRVRLITVPGTADRESALVVERASGTTLVVNDVIWNVAHRGGLRGWLWKKAHLTSDAPTIPGFVVKKAIKNRGAFGKQLERWANIEDLRRIIVSHGDIIERDVPATLRDIAAKVAA